MRYLLLFLLALLPCCSPVGSSSGGDYWGNRPGPKDFRTVIIDAGHGGKDSGAVSRYTGQKEKDANLDLANRLRTQAIAAARLAVSCDTAGKSRARRWCWRSVGVGRAGGRSDRHHLWQVWKGGCDGYLFDHRVHLLLHMVDVAFNDDVRLVELVDLRTANQRALQTLLFACQTHSYPLSTSALIPWPLSHAEPLRCSCRRRRKALSAARHLPIERAQRRVVGRLASQPRYLAGGSLSLAEE